MTTEIIASRAATQTRIAADLETWRQSFEAGEH